MEKTTIDKEVRMVVATVAKIKPIKDTNKWEITTQRGNIIYTNEPNTDKEIKKGQEYELAYFEDEKKDKVLYTFF